jgi:hypothetical protein
MVLAVALGGCGESEKSKEIGRIPKQTVDRVTTGVGSAMQQGQGSERLKEEEQK